VVATAATETEEIVVSIEKDVAVVSAATETEEIEVSAENDVVDLIVNAATAVTETEEVVVIEISVATETEENVVNVVNDANRFLDTENGVSRTVSGTIVFSPSLSLPLVLLKVINLSYRVTIVRLGATRWWFRWRQR
jgi:hypothetical protein